MKYPITVRDAQRIISKGRPNAGIFYVPSEQESIFVALGLSDSWGEYERNLKAASSLLAKLAANKGPNAVLISAPLKDSPNESSGENRPKGTDEVRPQGDDPSDASPFHGGDGASGEVGDSASTGPGGGDTSDEGAQSAAETGDSTSAGAGDQSPPGQRNPVRRDGAGAGEDRVESGENGSSGEGTAEEADIGSPAESPQEVGESTGGTTGEPVMDSANPHEGDRESKDAGGGTDESPELPKGRKFVLAFSKGQRPQRQGGWSLASYASLADCEADPELVRQLRRILARLVGAGVEDAGPRWDWNAFCVRLLTGRPVAPARREEEVKRPALLVLVDTSGSCSGFTDRSLPVAKAAGKLGVSGCSVIVVNHANGYPHEAELDGRTLPVQDFSDEDGEDQVFAWYAEILRRYTLRVVVNLGDNDAEWLLVRLASVFSVQMLVWLDNYACNYLDGPTPDRLTEFPPILRRKTRRYVGCKDEVDLVRGLELAVR